MELVLATINSHKAYEWRELFGQFLPNLQLVTLFDFPAYRNTLVAAEQSCVNAESKACNAAVALQRYALADTVTLFVPALCPNAPQDAQAKSTRERLKELLAKMHTLDELDRSAYIECTAALASPHGLVKTVKTRIEGTIACEERGCFGEEFESLFIKHDYSKTLGELPQSVRFRISNRGKVLEKLLPTLLSLPENSPWA